MIPVDILRNMIDKKIYITYTNGMTIVGELYTYDLGYGIITIKIGNDNIVVMLNAVRTIQKV